MIVDGDEVAVRWASTGTHLGELRGIVFTGKNFSLGGITSVRFANGRIVREWANWDTLGMMQQLGTISQ